jgi:hypothetical protein
MYSYNSFSLRQQQKSFVIAQSVKVTVFFSDRHFDDSFNAWQKGDVSDLSETFQKVFLDAIESSIRFAKSVEDKKRVDHLQSDIDKHDNSIWASITTYFRAKLFRSNIQSRQ